MNMFVVSDNPPGCAIPSPARRASSGAGWPDLLARLAAARSARVHPGDRAAAAALGDRGSFDMAAAAFISSHFAPNDPVNPIDLANSKPAWITTRSAPGLAGIGNRG